MRRSSVVSYNASPGHSPSKQKQHAKAYDIAVGVWQHHWSTDVSAVIALEPTIIIRCFYQAKRLDLVHFSNLGAGVVMSSSVRRRHDVGGGTTPEDASLSAAWDEHDAYMERPQVTVREVGSVSLAPFIDLVVSWLRSTSSRHPTPTDGEDTSPPPPITGRAFSIHHFTLETPPTTDTTPTPTVIHSQSSPSVSTNTPAAAAASSSSCSATAPLPGEYILCLLEGCPNAFLVFRIHQYQRYAFVGMGYIRSPLEDAYTPSHIAVFGSTKTTKYALAYDAVTGSYVVLSLTKMVAMAMFNATPYMQQRPSPSSTPPPSSCPATPPQPFEIECGSFEKDWCDVVWKGTPHALSTRHRFYCYNAVTGATSYESVRVAEEHALLDGMVMHQQDAFDETYATVDNDVVNCGGVGGGAAEYLSSVEDGGEKPFGDAPPPTEAGGEQHFTPERLSASAAKDGAVGAGGGSGDPPQRSMEGRRLPSYRRMTFSPCRREVLTRRLQGSLLVPMCLEGSVGALLYSHSHATVPGGGRSTGRVPSLTPHTAPSHLPPGENSMSTTSSKAVSAMLRKRVFDHQEPWDICTLLGGMVGSGSGGAGGGSGDGLDASQPSQMAPSVGGGFAPPPQSTFLLTYSRATGAVWLSRIYKIGVSGRKRGLDVSLPSVLGGAPVSASSPQELKGTAASRSLPPVPPSKGGVLGAGMRTSRPASGSARHSPNKRKVPSSAGSTRRSSADGSDAGGGKSNRLRTPRGGASESGDNILLLGDEGESTGRPTHVTTRFSSACSASRSTITISTRSHSPRGITTEYQSVVVRDVQAADDDDDENEEDAVADVPEESTHGSTGEGEDDNTDLSETNTEPLGVDGRPSTSPAGSTRRRGKKGQSPLSDREGGDGVDEDNDAVNKKRKNSPERPATSPASAGAASKPPGKNAPLSHAPTTPAGPKPWGNAGGNSRVGGTAVPRAQRSKYSSNKGAMDEWRQFAAANGHTVPPLGGSDPHIEPHTSNTMDADQTDRANNRKQWQKGWEGDAEATPKRSLRPSRNRSSVTSPSRDVAHLPKRPPPRVTAPDTATGFSPRILRRYGRNIHFDEAAIDDDEDDDEAANSMRWGDEEPDLQTLHNWLKTPQGTQPRGAPSQLDRLKSRAAGMPTLSGEFDDDMEVLIKLSGAAPEVIEKAIEMLQNGKVSEGNRRTATPHQGAAWCGGGARPSSSSATTFVSPPPPSSPLAKFLKQQDAKRQERAASDAKFTFETAEKLFKPVHTREAFVAREFGKIGKASKINCNDKDPKEVLKTLHKLGVQDIDIRKANLEVKKRKYAKEDAERQKSIPRLTAEEHEALVLKTDERTKLHREHLARLVKNRDKKEKFVARTLTKAEMESAAARLGGNDVHKQKAEVVSTILKSLEAKLPPKVFRDRAELEEVGARLFANVKPQKTA